MSRFIIYWISFNHEIRRFPQNCIKSFLNFAFNYNKKQSGQIWNIYTFIYIFIFKTKIVIVHREQRNVMLN